jgi:hypothetical protein
LLKTLAGILVTSEVDSRQTRDSENNAKSTNYVTAWSWWKWKDCSVDLVSEYAKEYFGFLE